MLSNIQHCVCVLPSDGNRNNNNRDALSEMLRYCSNTILYSILSLLGSQEWAKPHHATKLPGTWQRDCYNSINSLQSKLEDHS